MPGEAIHSVKLTRDRTVLGTLIQSLVYDELAFYAFDEVDADFWYWSNGGVVSMALKPCASETTTTPPTTTTTTPTEWWASGTPP
ncbi:MAG: hypothetical protein F4117_09185 [Acidimicrobiales bacterium]|nr:hypothetical protein [Acidimicrobiaceae bacterium]MXV88505.1 hypothetical protein [Acidimicrobiales bacterium]MCY3607888.1 hypothetical protein [Acidimicrobiaceae bacterium]MDE0676881.1 hypothetical protein [Acidimicrobiaceae bacterium]MXX44463.1 hypothetical protein [Acidimicrobiales bacterium]